MMKKILFCLVMVFTALDCNTAERTITQKNTSADISPTVIRDSVSINFTAKINELQEKLSSDFIVKEHSYFVATFS